MYPVMQFSHFKQLKWSKKLFSNGRSQEIATYIVLHFICNAHHHGDPKLDLSKPYELAS